MPYNPKYNEHYYKYRKEKYKRVGIDFTETDYEEIKAAADHSGDTVNGFIRKAIREKLDGQAPSPPPQEKTVEVFQA